ncbi:MAG: crossover junction endodeoxyribonuclease RuvC [Alphaproteobacteria bacterium]|nr:crossover junction endodeoxyribonuclease RuvC [Alphaproteobacteria bacterium]MBU0798471.1 crossover junction endodeoxyribonuclease RuvC [Alphaproteobacteria bacterium]MBU0886716.1 crossover junction endodeoxyribonuclease RuvC [Alphaproteobacteria bacterium]MBU1812556.1 crossover junction endodeoxyribonuclease RuvC [Alphaproteobacteria bacterium]
MRLIGLDPGLRNTGWGVIDVEGTRLRHVANGVVRSDSTLDIASRLLQLNQGVAEVLEQFHPGEAAIEQTFVNKNPESTLKLGLARGAVILAPACRGIPVTEYAPNRVKKAVVGAGHAAKEQVQMMVRTLLPGSEAGSADAADALAVAICHAHFRQTSAVYARALAMAGAQGGRTAAK